MVVRMSSILIFLIHIYQKIPLISHKMCRYDPTCSNYAIECLEEYGTLKGTKMAIKRILKCHPMGGYGYDPVPKKELQNEKI